MSRVICDSTFQIIKLRLREESFFARGLMVGICRTGCQILRHQAFCPMPDGHSSNTSPDKRAGQSASGTLPGSWKESSKALAFQGGLVLPLLVSGKS